MTLLPVDYKVMAKVLTIWLWGVMALVVSDVQTCGVDGRPCGLPLALLSLDQEKAFNRVSHRLFFFSWSCSVWGLGRVFSTGSICCTLVQRAGSG